VSLKKSGRISTRKPNKPGFMDQLKAAAGADDDGDDADVD
jgi:hypothetical protein